jgi:hypothetical protein
MRSAGKGGRPPTGRPTGRKATIYLLPDVEAKAKAIGAGNLSGGVAKAVTYMHSIEFSMPRKRASDSGTVQRSKK